MGATVTPEIIVEITLLPTQEGGRQGAILQGEYRGVLGVGTENFSVRFFVPVEPGLNPGETSRFGVQFLFPKMALPYFPVGTLFTVWEGGIIGQGQVLEVLKHA